MKNYDQSVDINHNPNLSDNLDHPYRILIIDGLTSGKTNPFLSLRRKHKRPDIEKIYLYVKHQLLINSIEKLVIKKLKNPRTFIEYSKKLMMCRKT